MIEQAIAPAKAIVKVLAENGYSSYNNKYTLTQSVKAYRNKNDDVVIEAIRDLMEQYGIPELQKNDRKAKSGFLIKRTESTYTWRNNGALIIRLFGEAARTKGVA